MADELKALGNKAIAEKDFDQAVYVYLSLCRSQVLESMGKILLKALVEGLEDSLRRTSAIAF